ncbi:MAG: hypothetical protein WCD21_41040 [Streptomyces sp.]
MLSSSDGEIRTRRAQGARPQPTARRAGVRASLAPPVEDFTPAPDPMADCEPGDDYPDMVPVGIAWLRVRREIRAIGKGELYNALGTKFNFRGVDTVVNVEVAFVDLADQIAVDVQRCPMAYAPRGWPTADRARRDQLAHADALDPRHQDRPQALRRRRYPGP